MKQEDKIIELLEKLLKKVDKLESDIHALRNETSFRQFTEAPKLPKKQMSYDCGCLFNHPCNSTTCPRRVTIHGL